MRGAIERVVVFAPHFAEYSTRLALALSARSKVMLIVDDRNFRQECDQALLKEAAKRLSVMEFNTASRVACAISRVRVILGILAFRPDFISVQEQIDSVTATVVWAVGRIFPILLTVHDPTPHSGNDTQYVIENAQNRRTIREMARAFHVHGPFCAQQLRQQIGGGRPILETTHGIILGAHEQGPAEKGRILMFGRMEAYKGLEVLLDAAQELHRRQIDFKLVVAGRGPEMARLATKLSRIPSIEVIGAFLSPEEAAKEFQRACLAVTPYLNATQSGVANGRPVVASRTGGLADAVTHGVNGLLVPPGDAVALADALEKSLQTPELLARLTAGAREAAAMRHAWSHIGERTLEFAATALK